MDNRLISVVAQYAYYHSRQFENKYFRPVNDVPHACVILGIELTEEELQSCVKLAEKIAGCSTMVDFYLD